MGEDIKEALRAGYIANAVMTNHTAHMSYHNKVYYQERYIVETRPIIHHPIITVFDVCAAIEANNSNMFDPVVGKAILTMKERAVFLLKFTIHHLILLSYRLISYLNNTDTKSNYREGKVEIQIHLAFILNKMR